MKRGITTSKKRGGNRLVYQTEQALKSINRIGTSKKAAREIGEKWIHSVSQIEKSISVAQNFVKWAKSQGLKDLYQLKRSHYRDYIDYMRLKGVSNGHLINIETNLRLLQRGMEQISIEKGHSPRIWVPKKRLVAISEREKPVDRSLSVENSQKVGELLSQNAKEAQLLQEAFGLRLRELAGSTTHYIVNRDGNFYWEALNAPEALNQAKGLTKAGRPRSVPCEPSKAMEVGKVLASRKEGEYLIKIRYNSIRSAYNRAGISGSHSFRHTYARNMMRREVVKRGISLDAARQTLENYIEIKDHGNNSKKLEQLKATENFKQLKVCMDKVHEYLGHGQGRMDLARIYISGF